MPMIRRLARSVRAGTAAEQIKELEGGGCPARLMEPHAPRLLTAVGIGPDAAVTLLITVGGQPGTPGQ